MIDPISDMLTRIRNAQAAAHSSVLIPASKLKFAIAQVLMKEGFIEGVEKTEDADSGHPMIKVDLSYEKVSHARKKARISGLEQVSRQGQRCYVKSTDIHEVKNGFGVSVVSTSQGVMTGRSARKRGLGGEMICRAW